jgi:hypothetical protein
VLGCCGGAADGSAARVVEIHAASEAHAPWVRGVMMVIDDDGDDVVVVDHDHDHVLIIMTVILMMMTTRVDAPT